MTKLFITFFGAALLMAYVQFGTPTAAEHPAAPLIAGLVFIIGTTILFNRRVLR